MGGGKKKKQQAKAEKATTRAKQLAPKLTAQLAEAKVEIQAAKKERRALVREAQFAQSANGKQLRRILERYLACLTYPCYSTRFRVPDGYPRRTALIASLQTISVMPNNADDSAASDKGRFAFCVSPTIAGSSFLRNAASMSPVESNGGTPVGGQSYYNYALGCKVAEVNPNSQWDPSTSFQDLTPSPVKGPKIRMNPSPLAPPVVPSNNQWRFYADPNTTEMAGTSTTTANMATYFENGVIESMRPVAMSVWFQRDASDMLNGGEIAAALMPPDSLLGNVVPYNWNDATVGNGTWGGQGPIQNVENLAQVPGSYSGPMRTGSYTYWVPHRLADTDFVSVQGNVTADYPWIMVSGKAQTYDQGEVGRLVINTVWEYTTVSQSRETEMGEFDPELFKFLKHILRNQPTSMANEGHDTWWRHLLKLAGTAALGFLSGGPAGAIAGAAGYAIANV